MKSPCVVVLRAVILAAVFSMLAACQDSQPPDTSTGGLVIYQYRIAVVPANTAVQVISDVRSRTTSISSLLANGPGFAPLCEVRLVTGSSTFPELSTQPGLRPAGPSYVGDRAFQLRVVADGAVSVPQPLCGTIQDMWFNMGGGAVPPVPPLTLQQETTDVSGRFVLTSVTIPRQNQTGVTLPQMDFSSPEFATGLLSDFQLGPPRTARGVFQFIDSVPLPSDPQIRDRTAVILGEIEFELERS